MKLCKSYRSTLKLPVWRRKFQAAMNWKPIMRHGEQPEIFPFKNAEEETTGIV